MMHKRLFVIMLECNEPPTICHKCSWRRSEGKTCLTSGWQIGVSVKPWPTAGVVTNVGSFPGTSGELTTQRGKLSYGCFMGRIAEMHTRARDPHVTIECTDPRITGGQFPLPPIYCTMTSYLEYAYEDDPCTFVLTHTGNRFEAANVKPLRLNADDPLDFLLDG